MKKAMCLAILCFMVAAAAAAMMEEAASMTAMMEEAAPMAAPSPCIVTELSPCAGLLLTPGRGAAQPSQACCSRLKEQEHCLCGYINDPIIGPYINAINTRSVSATCGVPIPTC